MAERERTFFSLSHDPGTPWGGGRQWESCRGNCSAEDARQMKGRASWLNTEFELWNSLLQDVAMDTSTQHSFERELDNLLEVKSIYGSQL